MDYKTFETFFLSVGVFEFEFFNKENKKEGSIGCYAGNENSKLFIWYDHQTFEFNSRLELLQAKVIEDKSLEEIFNEIQIDFIDGLDDVEYEKRCNHFRAYSEHQLKEF